MLIFTNVSGSSVTATYSLSASGEEVIHATTYDYDDDSGPRLNHSAAMRRLAETLIGKAAAYDGEWVGIMISGTTCAWTRKPYTIS